MFDVVLMTNSSPRNYLDKSVATIATVSGVLREGSDMVNPTIEIEYASSPDMVNYVHIAEFGRYYYVNDITSTRNGLWSFSCSSDPLMSFRSQIRGCTGILRRAESNQATNMMLDDGSFRVFANPHIITKNFPSGFSSPSYVLAIAGGGGSNVSSGNGGESE